MHLKMGTNDEMKTFALVSDVVAVEESMFFKK